MTINTVINDDCLKAMSRMKSESVDFIFVDPPYNLQLSKDLIRPNSTEVEGVKEEWDKFLSFEEYDAFTKQWLTECQRLLKKDGSIVVMGMYHNIFRVGKIMQDLGYWILNDILWIKHNPMPNFTGKRLANAHETLIWASKSKDSNYTFNYKLLKAGNEDKQERSDWYFPICSGNERIKLRGNKAHPTQKPESLLTKIILGFTNEGDLVLDPLCGSGTSVVVAKKFGRNYIGIDSNSEYVAVANSRLNHTLPVNSSNYTNKMDVFVPKVPFATIVSLGLLKEGTELYDRSGNIKAIIESGGYLSTDDFSGSIHKTACHVSKKPSVNGWDYWHYNTPEGLKPISKIRKVYISNEESN